MSENAADKAIEYIRVNSVAFSQAKAKRIYLEQYRKSLKATLAVKFRADNPKSRATDAEEYAYSHQDYLDLLAGLREAVQKEEELRYMIMAAQNRFEQWRTLEASNRHERKNMGA